MDPWPPLSNWTDAGLGGDAGGGGDSPGTMACVGFSEGLGMNGRNIVYVYMQKGFQDAPLTVAAGPFSLFAIW